MLSLTALWWPILLSAVVIFIASAVLHMVLPLHRKDYRQLPDEAGTLEAMRRLNLPPGNYCLPWAGDGATAKTPAFQEKMQQGPLALLLVRAGGSFNLGAILAQWLVYTIVVSVLVAYIASRTLPAGEDYLAVFRVTGTAAFLVYAVGQPIESIWFYRNWSTTVKNVVDGLIYALLTGGIFGWLWPQ